MWCAWVWWCVLYVCVVCACVCKQLPTQGEVCTIARLVVERPWFPINTLIVSVFQTFRLARVVRYQLVIFTYFCVSKETSLEANTLAK
jgi:hypothetical protein